MKNYFVLTVIISLVVVILVQNQLNKEQTRMMEDNFFIAYHYSSLKKGMSKAEVLQTLVFPPEDVQKKLGTPKYEIFETADGTTRFHWSNSKCQGCLREFLGITDEPKSSIYMDLWLEFDKDEKLVGVYYGG